MNSLIIYDSNFGNTKIIAQAMADELQAKAISVSEVKPETLNGIDLLIIGSPINAWNPSSNIKKFLNALPNNKLSKVKGAAFDTRIKTFFSGNAAKKISKALERAGVTIVAAPMGFYVKDKTGPLAEGEVEHSKNWAKQIYRGIK